MDSDSSDQSSPLNLQPPSNKQMRMDSQSSNEFFIQGPLQSPLDFINTIQTLPANITSIFIQNITFTEEQLTTFAAILRQRILIQLEISNCQLLLGKPQNQQQSTQEQQQQLQLQLNRASSLPSFYCAGFPENFVYQILNGNPYIELQQFPISIKIHNCFLHEDAVIGKSILSFVHPQQITQLNLQNIQIESENLLNGLSLCTELELVELKNIVLFGHIDQNRKIRWTKLKSFELYLNRYYDPGFSIEDDGEDEDPEILAKKLHELILFEPSSPSTTAVSSSSPIQVKIARLHEGNWKHHFIYSPDGRSDGTIVKTALNWNSNILRYIQLPKLKELTLFNFCSISNINLIPVENLNKLTISGIHITFKGLSAFLQKIASNISTIENLTIREHSLVKLNDLNTSANLNELILIQTEISTVSEHFQHQSPKSIFPNLSSIALIDCNLTQDFTKVFEYNFKNVKQISIQDFPISCELIYKILHEFRYVNKLTLNKFDLDGTWEGREFNEDEIEGQTKYYQLLRDFFIQEVGLVEITNCKYLELVKVGGTQWECKSFSNENSNITTKNFPIIISEEADLNFDEHYNQGLFNNNDNEEEFNTFLSNNAMTLNKFEQLRLIKLSNIKFTFNNLIFLKYCTNLISLEFESVQINNQLEFLNVLEKLRGMIFRKLQLFKLGLARSKNFEIDKISTNELIKLIWFSKNGNLEENSNTFSLRNMLSWTNISIVIEIGMKTLFELNWKTGLLNLSQITDGSLIFQDNSSLLRSPALPPIAIASNSSQTSINLPGFGFIIKSLALNELQIPIPIGIQRSIETISITNAIVEFTILKESVQSCTVLKELNLKEVKIVNVPEDIGFGFIKHLEKINFTRME